MVTVEVTGHGKFVIRSEKLNELLAWLKSNSMPVESINPQQDEFLLNE